MAALVNGTVIFRFFSLSLVVLLQNTFLQQTRTSRCAFPHQRANKMLGKTFQNSLLFCPCIYAVYISLYVKVELGELTGRRQQGAAQRLHRSESFR